MPWLGLLATLVWNYHRHLAGRSTICQTTRRTIPARLVVPLWGAFSAYIVTHLIRGYPRPPKES